jgi:hypothetical protein
MTKRLVLHLRGLRLPSMSSANIEPIKTSSNNVCQPRISNLFIVLCEMYQSHDGHGEYDCRAAPDELLEAALVHGWLCLDAWTPESYSRDRVSRRL